jgi:hypothetical protein
MLRIPNNVLVFAQGKTDAYELFHDYFNHYRAEKYKAIVSYEKEITFAEKEKKMHKMLIDEIYRVANIPAATDFALEVQATNPQFRWAAFAVISNMIDMVLPETIIDSVGLYTDVRTGGYGDSFAFNVKPRDIIAVTKAGRGKRVSNVQKQFNGQITLVPVEHDVTVGVSLYSVLAGKENLAELVMKCVRGMETEMAYDCYSAFNTAMTSLPTTPADGELKLTGWSQSNATKIAQRVTQWNGGASAVLAGTKLALGNVLPNDANYRYDLQSDYVKIGYIRTAFGYDCMELTQAADYATPFKLLLDDTRIHIVSPSAGKIVRLAIEGSTIPIGSGAYANANLMETYTMKKSWIAGVATSAVAGLIALS